jgi:hypothetical protein
MNMYEFAREHNLITYLDYTSECHSMASPASKNVSKRKYDNCKKYLMNLLQQAIETEKLYNTAVLSGEITGDKKLTTVESLLQTACKDPLMSSTKAAKRALRNRINRGSIECPICSGTRYTALEESLLRNSIITEKECWLCV